MTYMKSNADPSLIGRIVVIVPAFRQWSGTRAMREQDYQVGQGGQLPPRSITRSLGLKAIIDTKTLSVFDRLKHRAEAILESCGVRYLSGWAIPESKADEVIRLLDDVVAEYENEKSSFLSRYDSLVDEWAKAHQAFEREILDSKLDVNSVAEKISAGYEPFRLMPVSDAKAASLAESVSGLSSELIASVARDARVFFKESFLNKNRANRKTVNAVGRIRERLNGLSFLSSSIQPIITMIDKVLATMPSEGYFSGEPFWKLATLIQTLGDEALLAEIIRGQQSVSGLVGSSANETGAVGVAADTAACGQSFEQQALELTEEPGSSKEKHSSAEESLTFGTSSEPGDSDYGVAPEPSDSDGELEAIDRFFDDEPNSQSTASASTPCADAMQSSRQPQIPPPVSLSASLPEVDIGEGLYF